MISEEHVEELAKTVWGGWETRYESHRQEARREARLYLEAIHANPSISGFQTMTVSEARLHPWLGISDGVPWLVIPDPPKCDAIYTPSLDEVIAALDEVECVMDVDDPRNLVEYRDVVSAIRGLWNTLPPTPDCAIAGEASR